MSTYHPIVIHVSNNNKSTIPGISFDVSPPSELLITSFVTGDNACSPGQSLGPGKSCNLFLSLKTIGNTASSTKLNVRFCGFGGNLCTRFVLPVQIQQGFPVKVTGYVLQGLPEHVLANTRYPVTFVYRNEDETLPATGVAIDKYIPGQFQDYTEYGNCTGVLPPGGKCVISGVIDTDQAPIEAAVQLNYIEGYAPRLSTQANDISSGELAILLGWYGGLNFSISTSDDTGYLKFSNLNNPQGISYDNYPDYSAGNGIASTNGAGYEFFSNNDLYSCLINNSQNSISCSSQKSLIGKVGYIHRYSDRHGSLDLAVADHSIYMCQQSASGSVDFDSCVPTGKSTSGQDKMFILRSTGDVLLKATQGVELCDIDPSIDRQSGVFTSCKIKQDAAGALKFLVFDAGDRIMFFYSNHNYKICNVDGLGEVSHCVAGIFDKNIVIQNPQNTVVSLNDYIYFTQPLSLSKYGSISSCHIDLQNNSLENCTLEYANRPSSLAFIVE